MFLADWIQTAKIAGLRLQMWFRSTHAPTFGVYGGGKDLAYLNTYVCGGSKQNRARNRRIDEEKPNGNPKPTAASPPRMFPKTTN